MPIHESIRTIQNKYVRHASKVKVTELCLFLKAKYKYKYFQNIFKICLLVIIPSFMSNNKVANNIRPIRIVKYDILLCKLQFSLIP